MEQTFTEDGRTTDEHAKHHLTLEEQLIQLEAKEKKAKETEARRKAKMAKLRGAKIITPEQLDKVIHSALQYDSNLITGPREENR